MFPMDSEFSHQKTHPPAPADDGNHPQIMPMLPSIHLDASRQSEFIQYNMPEALMSFQRKDAIFAGGGKG